LQNFSKLFKTFQNFLNFSKNQHFQQKTNFSKRSKTFQNICFFYFIKTGSKMKINKKLKNSIFNDAAQWIVDKKRTS